MKKLQKWISLLLCLCMLAGVAALAEDTGDTADASEAAVGIQELNADDVLATVGDVNVTWGDIEPVYNNLVSQYGSYYDLTDLSNVQLFRAVALEQQLTEVVMGIKAEEFGLDQLTDEEIAQAEAEAETDWNDAIDNYVSYFHSELTDESSEEELAAAQAEAEQYYLDAGWTLDILKEDYKRYVVLDKVEDMMVQDATVTDEEIEEEYQRLVAADKELYENDIAAYVDYNNYVEQMALYAYYYGMDSGLDHAWYKPDGFRAVKHILLPVDQTLMDTYTDLQARYEEQQEAAAAAEEEAADDGAADDADAADDAVEPEATEEPVTEQQVNEAKAAIFASLADTIDEINQKIADGEDFDELIATYGVNEDGTASDPGMTSEPYKTSGYEVCALSSNYVPEFVEAAMSIDSVGEVSAPYLSTYGIHIVKYIGDIPGGPVEMTDEERQAKYDALLETRQSDLYTSTLETWIAEAGIVYTGVTPSIAELEAAQAAEDEAQYTDEASDAVSEEEAEALVDDQEPEAEPESTDAAE